MAELKLGKRPATDDDRDLLFATYATMPTVLPEVPERFTPYRVIHEWGMLGNGPDAEMGPSFQGTGDCVWAGAAHETMLWTNEAGEEAIFNTHGVLADYSAVTGYDPADPTTDGGTEVRQALNYRHKTGIVDARARRHTVKAFMKLEPGNLDHLFAAMYLFKAVGVGIEFPRSAMDQFNAGKPWTPVHGSTIDGGHYIPLVGRNGDTLYCVTWGKVQRMSVSFLQTYCDEAWALLSEEMFAGDTDIDGFDMDQLLADLKAVSSAGGG